MVYILLALALLAGLTMVLSRGASTGGDDLDAEKAELLTTKTVAYAGSAKNVVDQMMMSGTNVASLDFSYPGTASFDAGVHIHKVFHPAGGGLTLPGSDSEMFTQTAPLAGWFMGRFNNIAWTPTSANDVVLTALNVTEAVCANINKKITDSTAIPTIVGGPGDIASFFVDFDTSGVANTDLTNVECGDCEGYPSLCVQQNGEFAYYNIISAQ